MRIFNLKEKEVIAILLPDGLSKAGLSELLENTTLLLEAAITYFERTLFSLFQLDNGTQLPIAALTALGGGLAANQGGWLRADPCEIVVGTHNAYLVGNNHLQITLEEMAELQLLLNPLLLEDEVQLHMLSNQEWCLQLTAIPQLVSYSPSQVMGKGIHHYLLQGKDAKKWQILLTEIQMLLYASAVNQRRAAARLPLISSVWFWGEGALPKSNRSSGLQQVWSDNILVRGLAILTETEITKLPRNFSECLLQMKRPGKYLLDLRGISGEEEIIAQWLTPILTAVRSRKLTQVNLCLNDGSLYPLNYRRLRPWWRKIF
jgi:hypothetical protein